MQYQTELRNAAIKPEAGPKMPMPVFFDPTSRRKHILKILGFVLLVVFLTWSATFGLSLYVLAKVSDLDSHGGTGIHPIAAAVGDRAEPESAADRSAAPAPANDTPVYAYLPFWPDWNYVALAKALPKIDVLLPEWYRLDLKRATLQPLGFDEPHQRVVADLLRRKPSRMLMPVVDVGDGTNTVEIAAALGSAQAVERMAQSLAAIASQHDYGGLCLNLSGLPDASYVGAARLYALLHERFAGSGRETCLVSQLDSPIWRYAPIKRVVDRAVALGFRDAATMDRPGPAAPHDWFLNGVVSLLDALEPGKIVLVVGGMGYDWTAGDPRAHQVSYAEAMRLAGLHGATVSLDSASLNSSFSYASKTRSHSVWLLDAVSAYNQLAAVADAKLGGIGIWPLTDSDPSIWTLLKTELPVADPSPLVRHVAIDDYVGYEGSGPFHKLLGAPRPGIRAVETDPALGLIVGASYSRLPRPYSVLRYGAGQKGMVALTFDDGPDARYTGRVLEILKRYDVPATFFVIGRNALREPALVAEMERAGHEIGVHTFFHPKLENIPAWRIRFEVNATERLIASITGHRSLIFRSPYGTGQGPITGAEESPLGQIETYGYVVVGADIAPVDWSEAKADDILASVQAALNPASGSIIQLHDSGGDRRATVEALPRIIEMLRREGYTFVPLSAFLGQSKAALMPADNSYTAAFDALSFAAIRLAADPFHWLFWAVTVLGIGRAILVVVLALWRGRRVAPEGAFTPPVTVVISAFCEEMVIERTVAAVLASDYPSFGVIVVDDGSTDRTAAVIEAMYGADRRVRLVTQPNGGKFAALNRAYDLADTEIVVAIDADTVIHPDAIRKLVAHFQDPTVGAVAGNVRVSNRGSLLARLQALEYVTAQNLDRRAAEVYNGILVVPGAIGAWRREAVERAGRFSPATLAEDADLTVAIVRAGYRVLFEEAAFGSTEAPESIRQFLQQRLRWVLGMLQTAWKHRGAIAERRWIGLVSIPELFLFGIIMTIFAPVADILFGATLINAAIDALVLPAAQWSAPPLGIIVAYSIFLSSDVAIGLIALRFESTEDRRLLLLLPLQRFFYRQLIYISAIRAISAALSGRLMKWQKVTRALDNGVLSEAGPRAARRQVQLAPK